MPENKLQPKLGLWFGLLVLALLLGAAWWAASELALKSVDSYGECQKFSGAVIQESYPSVCRLPDGRTFVEVISYDQ